MIVGIGTDLIEIERIKKACEKEAFLVRVYTEEERRQAGGKDELGKPWVRLHGGAKKLADSLKITRIHVSITNTGSLASAYAVGEGEWK